MKIYLSGPMSGMMGLNFPAFHNAAASLRERGLEVVNPAEINTDVSADRSACLRRDIQALLDCDTIAMLPGWSKSEGATLERQIAITLKMDLYNVAALLKEYPPLDSGIPANNKAARTLLGLLAKHGPMSALGLSTVALGMPRRTLNRNVSLLREKKRIHVARWMVEPQAPHGNPVFALGPGFDVDRPDFGAPKRSTKPKPPRLAPDENPRPLKEIVASIKSADDARANPFAAMLGQMGAI